MGAMSAKDLIPPSPSEDEYAALKPGAVEDLHAPDEPFALFGQWLSDAKAGEPHDANAMTVATVDADGMPDARMVLLKGFDATGFVFFTNLESAKGQELAGNPKAALLFHWKSLRRQVRLEGPISPTTPEEADAYFATRDRGSQIGAWASDQSRPLTDRAALEQAVARETESFEGQDVPRPERWTGWRVVPATVEFWRDRPFRLHDRLRFERDGAVWTKTRLQP
jgi:pyridoxamine 5'-phosphate oxidase